MKSMAEGERTVQTVALTPEAEECYQLSKARLLAESVPGPLPMKRKSFLSKVCDAGMMPK